MPEVGVLVLPGNWRQFAKPYDGIFGVSFFQDWVSDVIVRPMVAMEDGLPDSRSFAVVIDEKNDVWELIGEVNLIVMRRLNFSIAPESFGMWLGPKQYSK